MKGMNIMKKKILLPIIIAGAMMLSVGCGKSQNSKQGLTPSGYDPEPNYYGAADYSDREGYGYTNDIEYAAAGDEAYYEDDYDYYEEAATEAELKTGDRTLDTSADEGSDGAIKKDDVKLNTEMLVYRGNINIETKEFDSEKKKLQDYIDSKGGIIEEESSVSGSYYNVSKKTYTATVRIPSAQFKDVMSGIEGFGNVVSSSSTVENMSKQYEYNNRQLDILKAKQEAYITALASITDPVDMANVEASLAEIQQQILYLSQQQSDIETDVAYSYIYITINEVVNFTEPEPEYEKGFLGTMKEAFDEMGDRAFNFFVEGLLYFIIANLPILIFLGIIIAVIVVVIRVIIKKRAAKGGRTRLSRKEKREIKNIKKFAMMQKEYDQTLNSPTDETSANETSANEASTKEDSTIEDSTIEDSTKEKPASDTPADDTTK